MPNGAYGYYLLGVVSERLQKFQDAKVNYTKAIELNPTLWVAYEKLIKMGEEVVPNRVFSVKSKLSSSVTDSEVFGRKRTTQQIATNPKRGTGEKESNFLFM